MRAADKPPLGGVYLAHFGIKGMKWGVRKDRGDSSGVTKRDARWAKRKSEKITTKAQKKSSRELSRFSKDLLRDPSSRTQGGKLSSSAILAYNTKMAELMTQKVSKISSPSGKAVTFVAKRGQIGVFMALADQGYNMSQLKNGLHASGRVAYKKKVIEQV